MMSGNEVKKKLAEKFSVKTTDFSINRDKYSGGTSLRIQIKTPLISKEKVEKYVKDDLSQSKVRRCSTSGETLMGWNEYVFVDYSRNASDSEEVSTLITKRISTALLKFENSYLEGMIGDSYLVYEAIRSLLDSDSIEYEDILPGLENGDIMFLVRRSSFIQDLKSLIESKLS